MKKMTVLFMTILFAFSVTQGQDQKQEKAQIKEAKKEVKAERKALKKLEGTTVSPTAKSNFTGDFGNIADVKWTRSGTFDEAAFTKNGTAMRAFYDASGKLVGTTSVKTFADIPAKGQSEIKSKYKDYTVSKVILFDDNEANDTDMIMYDSQFDDADYYFVELAKGANKIVLQVSTTGEVFFFKNLS